MSNNRKDELLDIAYKMFIAKGYDNTSVDEIIKEAGIAKGTFYYYFTTKEEMLDYLKNNKVFNASLENDSIKTIGLARTYANDNKEEKRLFLYTYKDYAIIGFPKATFVGSSYSGNCKALFVKEDTILKEVDNFCSSASNSNSSFSIEDVKEQDNGYLFHLEVYDEGVYDEKDVFCERK